jgi:predicted nuclease with RNAse H fold
METTLGIDLASQPRNTALCAVAWSSERAEIVALARGGWGAEKLTDGVLVDAACGAHAIEDGWGDTGRAAKVAIDAPFGWPEPFVRAVEAHHRLKPWPPRPADLRWALERRATDRFVYDHARKLPLSVSTDRIAYPAMRCAGLLGALEDKLGAEQVARDGAGLVAEAYPDAALRCWLPDLWEARAGSYKGTAARARREHVVKTLLDRLGDRFAVSDKQRGMCVDSDDCLDALVCALLARAVQCGATIAPEHEEDRRLARVEGWIHLPAKPLAERPLL